jgi:hypothetical protein
MPIISMARLTSVDQYCPLEIWLDSEEEHGIDVSILRLLTEYGFPSGVGFNFGSHDDGFGDAYLYGRGEGYDSYFDQCNAYGDGYTYGADGHGYGYGDHSGTGEGSGYDFGT